MRVIHITDLHLHRPLRPSQLMGKRLLGSANLHLAGRAGRFQEATLRTLVADVVQRKPDLVVCTGDLTAMATDAEFEAVQELLRPLTERIDFLLVPGNHDVYTRGAFRERRLEARFSRFTGGGAYPALHRRGDLAFIGLDVCRPHPLLANGRMPADQLAELERLLGGDELRDIFTTILVHYPLRDRHGEPYGPWTRGLLNAAALESILVSSPQVGLILHGHEHHGFRSALPADHGPIPICDPGASGLAYRPDRGFTAHFNLYEIDAAGLGRVERFALQGERFVTEPGGAYRSGT